jgi:hypothetical protein
MIAYQRIVPWLMFLSFGAQAGTPSTDVDARLTTMQRQVDGMNKRLERMEQMLKLRLPPPDMNTADVGAAANVLTTAPATVSTQAEPQSIQTKSKPVQSKITLAQARPKLSAFHELDIIRTSWKQVKLGLSGRELSGLIGEPNSKSKLGREELWYYTYPGIGSGSVLLSGQDKVTSWQPPPLLVW